MYENFKKVFICFIIGFLIGCFGTLGGGFIFFKYKDEQYNEELRKRDSAIGQLRTTIEESKKTISSLEKEFERTIDQLENEDKQSSNTIDECFKLIDELRKNQSKIRSNLQKGKNEK